MRRGPNFRVGAVCIVALLSLALVAAAPSKSKKKAKRTTPPKVNETVDSLAFFYRASDVPVQGVGLVMGLDNTGSDPPPSTYRQKLLEQMRKSKVEHPERILKNPTTSLVIVRAKIPIGATKKDRIDLEIELPPGSSTSSLAGGRLLEASLSEILMAKDGVHEGTPWVVGGGPILLGNEKSPNDPKVGRVLGGGRIKKEFPYILVIRENRRSIKTSSILMNAINTRFYKHKGMDQVGMVSAKDVKRPDEQMLIEVPAIYHQNQGRFFQVVRTLPVANTPELEAARIAEWGKKLLNPATTAEAALRLEGLGASAIPTLAAGLKSENEQVKFFAAEALAYLNDASGAEILAENSVKRPQFRAFALAALAATDQPPSYLALKRLMNEADILVRYGAFNALRKVDENDPALGRVAVLEPRREELEDDDEDAMAVKAGRATRRPRPSRSEDDPFELYVVDSDGPPLVHVSGTRRAEIVLFGANLKLMSPAVLSGAGQILVNASMGDDKFQISKISPRALGDSDGKTTTSADVLSVIRGMAGLGASYPEVVSILQSASKQKNLPGPLAFDAVPPPDEAYLRALVGVDVTAKKDDALEKTKLDEEKDRGFFERLRDRFNR